MNFNTHDKELKFDNFLEFFVIIFFFFVFSLSITTFTIGLFYLGKYILFFDFLIFFLLCYFNKLIFKKLKINIYCILFVIYAFLIIIITFSYINTFPNTLGDFARYHLRLPLIWIDFNKFNSDNILLEQLPLWGVQHLVYTKFFLIFNKLDYSILYNFVILFIIFPISSYLLFKFFSKKNSLLLILISLIPLSSEYVLKAAYSGDNSLNVFIFFITFIVFLEKYLKTKSKLYLFISFLSVTFTLSEKLTGIFFLPSIVIYVFVRIKNFKILFYLALFIFLGSYKFIFNYVNYKNLFYPLYKEIPFIKQTKFDQELYLHHSCKNLKNNKNLKRFCYMAESEKKKTFDFKKNYMFIYRMILDKEKIQSTKSTDDNTFYNILLVFLTLILTYLILLNLFKKK
jgi:hypothetical protein